MNRINVYCDESCHLEHDHQKAMVLGAIWCPQQKVRDIFKEIRRIKIRHGLSNRFEIKWTKVSHSKIDFYVDLVNYFFSNKSLHFRALVIPDKSILQHELLGQDHETWYYKMYFNMLKIIISPNKRYRIYIDYKDTHGSKKIAKLHKVLCNNQYDFSRNIIERVQLVRSHEIELLQLTDLIMGAIAYANRELSGNRGKEELVNLIKNKSGYSLTKTTLTSEQKVNIFIWKAREIINAG